MSDYTPITDFSVKDLLTANDPEKIISGADVDGEFDAIQTAINSKYDSTDISTEVEAEAGTLDTKIITPLQLKNVLQDNGGIAYDLQQLAAPAADQVLCYDFGTTSAKGFTLGDGLEFSGDTIRLEHLGTASCSGMTAQASCSGWHLRTAFRSLVLASCLLTMHQRRVGPSAGPRVCPT
jgi:hypothetical protein